MLNRISFYQFDNLVRNRIPFMFINMNSDVSTWYDSIYKLHIQTNQVLTSLPEIPSVLDSKKIPKDFAILLLCQNGRESEKAATDLQKKGYTNVYLIDGGAQQMMTDKQNH